jgi:hypothetical protein
MKKLMTILAAGLMTAVVLANPVKADDENTKPSSKSTASALTDESLGVMLEQLGFEPKASKTSSGGTYYNIEIDNDGWTFPYVVELSPNKKFVWISISVRTFSEGQQPSAEVFQKLLEENDQNGPVKISFNSKSRKVILAMALFNRGITPAVLREQLNYLNGQTRTVSKLCEPSASQEK